MQRQVSKLLPYTAAILLAGHTLTAFADAGQFYIAPGLQFMMFDNGTQIENDEGYYIGLGYDFTDRWSAELSIVDLDPEYDDDGPDFDLDHWKIDLLYNLDFNLGVFDTFLVTGFGNTEFESYNDTVWDVGAGISYNLSDNVSWRTAARGFYYLNRDFEDQDWGIDTSIVIRFGGRRAPTPVAQTPPPAPAAPPPERDSDGDGVPDSRDACPDTPRNYAVDDRGCPIPVEEIARIELEVLFEFDRAEVRPQYFPEVEEVAEFMRQYPEVIVELEGHTDSVGAEEYNQGLSQRRADSVRQVLIDRFNIQGSRVTATGYGESQPIASNNTAEGRQQNRRVITVIIQTLQNYQPR